MDASILRILPLICLSMMQSRAETAGFLQSDDIVAINTRDMHSLEELREILEVHNDAWPNATNPCSSWLGVDCRGGHVISITLPNLRRPNAVSSNGSNLLDSAVEVLAKLPFLRILNASGSELQGSLPVAFGKLKQLEVLDLSSSSIHGMIPFTFSQLTKLRFLSLALNNLTGAVAPQLDALCSLQYLNLSSNSFTGKLPSSVLSCALQLVSIDLSHNGFEDTIPLSVGFLSHLQYLALDHNILQGYLPIDHQNWTHLEYLDLSNNLFSGSLPTSISHMKSLYYLNLGHNRLTGPIPATISECMKLKVLRLDDNRLDHGIPQSLTMLKNLAFLSLSSNNLTGILPSGIFTLPNLTSLDLAHNFFFGPLFLKEGCSSKFQSFDVSYNFLLGDIPVCLVGVMKNCFHKVPKQHTVRSCWLFYSRHGLSWHELLPKSIVPDDINISSQRHPGHTYRNEKLLVMLGCATGGSFILAILGACMIWLERFKQNLVVGLKASMIETGPDRLSGVSLSPMDNTFLGEAFSFDTLHQATDGFNSSRIIAHGQSGCFYKGTLDRGIVMVVKRIYTAKMMELYLNEIEVLSKASHIRLISLLGHCPDTTNERFLIYKYMPLRDLASMFQTKMMHNKMYKCRRRTLDWITRLKIATGVAEGLVYLHHECSPPIMHRDVKASSVLLDDMFEVRLGSLSTAGRGNKESHPRLISCLPGLSQSLEQADRDLDGTGCSKDVYDFGKLLLGIISGKCGISDKQDSQTQSWLEWAVSLINVHEKDALYQLIDPCMAVDGDFLEEVLAVALIAKACLNAKASKRLNMQLILKALENPRIVFEDKSLGKLSQISTQQNWSLFGSSRFAFGSPSSSGSGRTHTAAVDKTGNPTFLVQNISYINEISEIEED